MVLERSHRRRCVLRVGTLDIDVPEPVPTGDDDGDEGARTPPGAVPLVIDLHLVADGLDVSNHYGTWVVAGAHQH